MKDFCKKTKNCNEVLYKGTMCLSAVPEIGLEKLHTEILPIDATMNSELVALGQKIRHLRQERNITQGELAFRCGLHRTYLTDVERGARNLTFSSLLVIARGLGLTISELTRNVDAPVRQRLVIKKRCWRS